MTPLRLGTYGVSSAESGLIRALVRLFASGDDASFAWTFADAPPYDAVVAEAGTGNLPQSLPRGAVLLLAPAGTPAAEGVLARPVQIEVLQAWLMKVQQTAWVRGSNFDHLQTQPQPLEPSDAPPLESQQIWSQPLAQPQRDRPGRRTPRYKLRRWPPSEMLRNDTARVRMATLLSKRPMGVGEMADLSRQPLDRCTSFVHLLNSFGLLELHEEAAIQGPAAAPQAVQPRQDSRWNLVRGIRQRLGL